MPFSEKTTNATLSAYYFQAKLNIKSYGKYTPYTSQTIRFSENPREAITISKHSQTYHDDVTKHIRRPRLQEPDKNTGFPHHWVKPSGEVGNYRSRTDTGVI